MLKKEAADRGYTPDALVGAGDVPESRAEPWMCLENAKRLGIYPMESIVKVGEILPDIDEGLNAGRWTIGLTQTGNEIGLNDAEDLQRWLNLAYNRMQQTGAHYVVDGIGMCH